MSHPQPPKPAKLVIGLILKDVSVLGPVAEALEQRFGIPDMVSPWLPFDFTDYYLREMGAPLRRRMFSFRALIGQDTLPEVKLETNRIEDRFCIDGQRRVNIDPGILTFERFVLATGKNYTHRIYLGRGIFADLTLLFSGGGFQPLPWTYPDYAQTPLRSFLEEVRRRYRCNIRSQENLQAGGQGPGVMR